MSDANWKQLVVFMKPIANPVSGADKIAKFLLTKERGSLEQILMVVLQNTKDEANLGNFSVCTKNA